MASLFSFSFSGDDIESEDPTTKTRGDQDVQPEPRAVASAFPVQGKPLLPPVRHDLNEMLERLPSKIAYRTMQIQLDSGEILRLPQRELWDVRTQIMAEGDPSGDGDDEAEPGLGKHDVKSGIYEGGFKSWESSVDLVKTVAERQLFSDSQSRPSRVVELGCGTALPSLAVLKWELRATAKQTRQGPISLVLADYNPSVLYLVTLPNLLLTWALEHEQRLSVPGSLMDEEAELDITEELKLAFSDSLTTAGMSLLFISGAWSSSFVGLLYEGLPPLDRRSHGSTIIMAAETIYSPFALQSFAATLDEVLRREQNERGTDGRDSAVAMVAAKKLYFGVGGSLDDFIVTITALRYHVETLREATDGVHRGVVLCRPTFTS